MKTRQSAIYIIILSFIFLACGALWMWADYPVTHMSSDSGTRDLRGADFSSGCFDLFGPVEYIPNALLTPQEFEERQDEIKIGKPEKESRFSTSRLHIEAPEGTYGLMLWNAEYATNIYINGQLVEQVGVPASSAAFSVPGVKRLFFTVQARDGTIEIVQQASTYVFHEGDSHADIIIGKPETVRDIYSRQNLLASVAMGCFLVLALAHFVLFSLMRFYKANLWFAIFCAVWFFRIGYSDPWPLFSIFPLSWTVAFRLCSLTYPAGLLLLTLTLDALFPCVIQRRVRAALTSVCGIFACVCFFAGTAAVWTAISAFNVVILFTSIYILIRLCMKVRKPDIEQRTVLIGIGIFIFGVLRDILFFDVIPALHAIGFAASELTRQMMSEYALLAFVLFQMAAMFRGTMREMAEAKAAEQKLAMENAALDRVNRLKSEMMQKLTHEMRTPLAVMSTYVQFAVKGMRQENVNMQAADDLEAIREEAERLADMATDFLDVFRGQEKVRGRKAVDMGILLRQVGRLCAPMLNKNSNGLTVNVPEGLPRASGNADELTQVMLNVITNANNHTRGGEIAIDALAVKSGRAVVVTIADTGEGIAPDLLPGVFERHTTDGSGAGLGLFICREIMEAHDGKLTLKSEYGKGTKVQLTLPAWEGEGKHGKQSNGFDRGR